MMSQDPDKSRWSEQTNDPEGGKLSEGKCCYLADKKVLKGELRKNDEACVGLKINLSLRKPFDSYYKCFFGSLES